MSKYKFEEEVVEEEKVEETTEVKEESAPDSHEAFVNILVDMGLSAEQAEAVHQMAMDLIEASEGEVVEEKVTEEVKEEEKVEMSRRSRRGMRKGKKRYSKSRREMSSEELSDRKIARLRRQNIELRKQLREFGQSPATKPLRNAPFGNSEEDSTQHTMGKKASQAFNMISKNLNK
tara:strand:- start:6658 stop:7185 length:528 start_codon:yes stop_codon:yes gene_type:complete